MINIDNIYTEVYIILIVLAIIYYFLSKIDIKKLLALIIISILCYFIYFYLYNLSKKKILIYLISLII